MPAPPRHAMEHRVFCVLGMHRSGTSCLVGTLEDGGVFLGEVSRRNPHNRKGNLENQRIVDLHEELLAANGRAWDRPGAVTWGGSHRAERDRIIAGYGERPRWGFKDPRTLQVLDGWLEALPSLAMVGIFRHPALVARSLTARNGFEAERGLALWEAYNRLLLAVRSKHGIPLLGFDGPAEEFRRKAARLLLLLGLEPPPALRFFEPSLRHEEAPAMALPPVVAELYAELRAAAL